MPSVSLQPILRKPSMDLSRISFSTICCATYGDKDGDGFLEYERRCTSGLIHQGWKDSDDAVFHHDSSPVHGAIAICEVQGMPTLPIGPQACWQTFSDIAPTQSVSWGGLRLCGRPSTRPSGARNLPLTHLDWMRRSGAAVS